MEYYNLMVFMLNDSRENLICYNYYTYKFINGNVRDSSS